MENKLFDLAAKRHSIGMNINLKFAHSLMHKYAQKLSGK